MRRIIAGITLLAVATLGAAMTQAPDDTTTHDTYAPGGQVTRVIPEDTPHGTLAGTPAAPTVERMYEDGSYVMTDGTTGCMPDALCND